MKKIKIIILALGVLVGLALALFVLGASQVDRLAKVAIERGGTFAMQVDTSVESVDVSVTGGTATMSGLSIANPEGFSTDHFLALSQSNASLDIATLRSDTIVLPEITLSGIDVILDKGGDPSNYNTILNSLKRFESEDTGDGPTPGDESGKKLVIDALVLRDINIYLANMPGVSFAVGEVAINIPEITLEGVGREKSMTPAEVINLVVKTVLSAAVGAGGGIIPGDVLGELGNGLSGLKSLGEMGIGVIGDLDLDGALGEVGEQLQGVTGDAAEQAQDQLNQAAEEVKDKLNDGLKGIFGGNKDDP